MWCRFPHHGMGRPGPKPRAALVVDIGSIGSTPAVEVIYGTSQKLERLFAGEFAITPADGAAFRESGLEYPTKFDAARSVFLPYDGNWFSVPPHAPHGQTPRLGVLHPSLMRRAQTAFDAAKRRP